MTLIDQESGLNFQLNIYQNLDTRLIKNLIAEIAETVSINIAIAAQWHNEKSLWTVTFQWDIPDTLDPLVLKPYSFTKLLTVQDLKTASVGSVNVVATEISSIINQSIPDNLPSP